MSGNTTDPIPDELPWLYELSLVLGRTLDLSATCRGFLRALVTRPGLTGAAIWWRTAECEVAEGLRLLDAWPCSEAPPEVVPLTDPIWRLSRGGEPRVLSLREAEPEALGWATTGEDAGCALYPLGEDGVLLMRSSALDLFTPLMLARLGAVVGNLAMAIRGGPVHARLASSEAALRESEYHFRTLADAGTVLIRTSGVDRGCNYVNQPWLRFTGRDLEQELGLGWAEMVHPEDQALCLETYAKAFDRREPLGIEYRLRRADDEYRWIRDDGSPRHDSQGGFLGYIDHCHDVTERRLAEQRLSRAVEVAQMVLWELDFVTGRLSYDHAAMARLGLGEADRPGTLEDWVARVHPDDCPGFLDRVHRAMRPGGEPFDCEYRFRQASGCHQWLHTMGHMVRHDAEGAPLLAVGTSINITARKEAELALAESETRLRTLVEAVPDSIQFKDGAGRWLVANSVCLRLFGLEAQPWQGLTDTEIGRRHPHLATRMATCQSSDDLAWAHGGVVRVEEEVPRGDGLLSRFDVIKVPLFDEEGRRRALAIVGRDISEQRHAQERLLESEARLRHTLENTPNVAVQWYDCAGRVVYWNPASERLYGWSSAEALGRTLDQLFFSPEEAAAFGVLLRDLAQSGEVSGPAEYRTRDRHGHPRIVTGTLFPIPGDSQDDTILVCMDVDITERKAAEDSLRLAASVFSHAREGIMITAPNGDILDVNEAFTRITCYPREEVLGKNPRILSSGRQDRAFYAAMWGDLIEKGHWYGEIWNRRKTGDEYVAMLTVSAVHNGQGEILRYVALFSDITQSKEHERQLMHIAHYDALTGLPNRVLLGDRLRQAMGQAQRDGTRLAVAYLDLDGFKAVNDDHGHQTGDELLTALAARMKLSLREEDTIARLGGDEFVVVAPDLAHSPDAPPEVCLPLLSRLLGSVSEPVPVSGRVLQVSASLGVTFYPQEDEVDADQLLRQADQAMYQAKLSGKNRCHVFDNELDRLVRGHHEGLERIRLAMARDEFELVYQPRVNMRTGQVVGAEALIRWRHPERGLLAPEVFLPVLEGHSQSILLGEWVLDTALSQIEAWKGAGLGLSVSVNIDALQLQQPDFISRLRAQLAAHPGVTVGDLELEVLETSALEDITQASRVMLACRDLGIDFALDHFGAGYSSLTYLRRLPASQLKIDQSFVRGMLDDPEDLAILEGILGLARTFHRRAIAEGVASVAHGEMLLRLGCELAQGYGIARPMPAEAIPGWLTGWRPAPSWRNLPPISRDDRPILFAALEHRAWISALTGYLRGERDAPPLEPEQCRLAEWLDREGQTRHGGQVVFEAIVRLHREICARTSALLAQKRQGQGVAALAGLDELHGLRDAFLERVLVLLGAEAPRQT